MMQTCKLSPILISLRIKLTTVGNYFEDPSFYRIILGGLQYMTHDQPKIFYTLNKLSQSSQNTNQVH